MRHETRLATLAIAVPVLYFGTMLVAAATWPAYSHATQYVSELGGPDAPHPAVFNVGIIVMGTVCIAASFGVGRTAWRIGGRTGWSTLAGVSLGLFGAAMVMGGVFPMPNPLHGGFGLAFAQVVAPLFLSLAVRGDDGMKTLNRFLVFSFLFMVATMTVMMGVGQLVRRSNVGLWQRLNALAMFPWVAVAGFALARRAPRARAARGPGTL
jgi:hypothetical membrane protein